MKKNQILLKKNQKSKLFKAFMSVKFTILILFVGSLQVFAQQGITVTGTVTNTSGESIPGANVVIQGTTDGVLTDFDGKYSIKVPNTNTTLQFSFIGLKTETVRVGDRTQINVVLEEDAQLLGEVVVTALGISKERKKLGFSVSEVPAKEITLASEVSVVNALQGRVAGVQIDQSAAGPMGASKILIRGNSTLGRNNQPLFVIDGVFVDNEAVSAEDAFNNDLKNLNPEDYESISVLKGSAAAALYGSRAINGVILITTKKGRKQTGLGVNVAHSSVYYDPYKGPEFQNEFGGGSVGNFYTDWRDPGYNNAQDAFRSKVFPTNAAGEPYIDRQWGREAENFGPKFDGQRVRNYDGTWTTWEAKPNNFLDAFQAGHSMRTNVAVDGGGANTTFRISYTNEDNKGVTPTNKMTKNAINLRTTYDVNKYLGFDVVVDNTFTKSQNPEKVALGRQFLWVIPRNWDTKYWSQRENYTGVFGGRPRPDRNVDENNWAPGLDEVWSVYERSSVQEENALRARLAMTITPTDWMKIVFEGNINNLKKQREDKVMGNEDNFVGGRYYIYQSDKRTNFFKGLIALNKSIEDFNFSGHIGAETNFMKQFYTSAETAGGLKDPGKFYIANSVERATAAGGYNFKKRVNSIYASFDADYKNQLFLQTTWRADWSSALVYPDGTGTPRYSYPSASLAWIFTESFELPDFISFGKLRTNIAALGKDTDAFRLNPGYSFSGSYAYNPYNNSDVSKATFSNNSAMSLSIKPERKVAKEIGLELNFFQNRLNFDLSFYRDNTKNQIIELPTPRESGVSSILINAGNIQNQGIELKLDYIPVKTQNFEWSGTLNYSTNKNKIVELYEGREEFDLGGGIHVMQSYAIVGKAYGIIRTNAHSKPFQAEDSNGNPIDSPNNGKPILSWRNDGRTAFPGRSGEWVDMGDINSKFRSSMQNTIRYKNFSLQFLIDAKIGGDIVLYSYSMGTHTGLLPHTLQGRDAEHGGITWTSAWDGQTYDDGIIPDGVFPYGHQLDQPRGGRVDVGGMSFQQAYDAGYVEPSHLPLYLYRTGSWSTGTSDFWVFENSWIALRQVSLSYSFPSSIYSKMRLQGLNLSVYGRDLGYLYNSLPYDFNPVSYASNETSSVGETGFLPMIRSFGATIRLSF